MIYIIHFFNKSIANDFNLEIKNKLFYLKNKMSFGKEIYHI